MRARACWTPVGAPHAPSSHCPLLALGPWPARPLAHRPRPTILHSMPLCGCQAHSSQQGVR
eukprot:11196230-Lingulodinium_polyedra.AAC.1